MESLPLTEGEDATQSHKLVRQGRISMENIYVVLLVTAWVSTVTLVRTIHSTFIYHLNRRH